MNKAKMKKVWDTVVNVLMYIFLAICIFAVLITLLSKREPDGAAEIFGYQMRIVTSDSMEACEYTDVYGFEIKDIPITSMVFVQTVPDDAKQAGEWYKGIKVGDVLTFVYMYGDRENPQVTITHRVTSITEKASGGYAIELKGDNKNSKDGALTQTIHTDAEGEDALNYVIGKVVGHSPVLGAFLTFLKQPVTIILLIIIPCVVIMLLEVIKIVKTVTADKRKREEEERKQKDNELDELRRRLAELEKGKEDNTK